MTDDFASFVQQVTFPIGLNGLSPLVNFASFHGGDGDASSLAQQLQNSSSPVQQLNAKADAPVSPSDENVSKKRKLEETTKLSEKEKKEKKVKDPNAPKKPPSAFLLYLNHMRQDFKDAHPDVAGKDIQTKLVELWNSMSPEEKEVSIYSLFLFLFCRIKIDFIFCRIVLLLHIALE